MSYSLKDLAPNFTLVLKLKPFHCYQTSEKRSCHRWCLCISTSLSAQPPDDPLCGTRKITLNLLVTCRSFKMLLMEPIPGWQSASRLAAPRRAKTRRDCLLITFDRKLTRVIELVQAVAFAFVSASCALCDVTFPINSKKFPDRGSSGSNGLISTCAATTAIALVRCKVGALSFNAPTLARKTVWAIFVAIDTIDG